MCLHATNQMTVKEIKEELGRVRSRLRARLEFLIREPRNLASKSVIRVRQQQIGRLVKREFELEQKLQNQSGKRVKKKKNSRGQVAKSPSIVDQDTALLKFMRLCENFGLQKRKTIPRETLYKIMCAIGDFRGSINEFTTKSVAYVKGREYASRLGYSRKGSALYRK